MARRRVIPTPFCHGCRRPFAPGEQFVALADCVFHAMCREEFMELGAEVMARRYPSPAEDQLRLDVAELRAKISQLTADKDAAEANLKTVRRQRDAYKGQVETATNRYNTEHATVVMLQRQLGTAQAVVNAAAGLGTLRSRGDGGLGGALADAIAAAPVPVATPVAAPVAPAPVPVAEGPVDDPADRFSQIELD